MRRTTGSTRGKIEKGKSRQDALNLPPNQSLPNRVDDTIGGRELSTGRKEEGQLGSLVSKRGFELKGGGGSLYHLPCRGNKLFGMCIMKSPPKRSKKCGIFRTQKRSAKHYNKI